MEIFLFQGRKGKGVFREKVGFSGEGRPFAELTLRLCLLWKGLVKFFRLVFTPRFQFSGKTWRNKKTLLRSYAFQHFNLGSLSGKIPLTHPPKRQREGEEHNSKFHPGNMQTSSRGRRKRKRGDLGQERETPTTEKKKKNPGKGRTCEQAI